MRASPLECAHSEGVAEEMRSGERTARNAGANGVRGPKIKNSFNFNGLWRAAIDSDDHYVFAVGLR